MSTGTAHIPDAASPERSDRRATWLIVLAVVATLAVAAALALSYGVTAQNGSDLTSPNAWVLVTLVSLVPGCLVAAAVWLTWWPAPEKAPWLLAVVSACVLAVMAGVAGAAALGGRAYDDSQSVIAAACSAHDREVLDAFGSYGPEFSGAQGTEDGTCTAWIVFAGEDGQRAMATVSSSMVADGWATSSAAWDDKTFTKGSDVVRVTHLRSDEGSTSVGFTVVDPR